MRLPRPSARWIAPGCSIGAVAIAVLFVWLQMQPHLLLSDTTPAGGDMGAHVWLPAYVRENLFPQFRLSGWTPDWYAGFPALTFYFPLPTLVIAVLSFVIPYGVAFKLISVLGLLALPVAAALFAKWMGMRRPGPAVLAAATLPFMFDQGWTIYGGNVASTLAGEFSFTISLAFALLFLGMFARSLDTGRYRGWAALLLGLTILCHILPAFFAIIGAVAIWLHRPGARKLWSGVTVGVAGVLIPAFWLLPFAWRQAYTNDMGWEKLGDTGSKGFSYYLFGVGDRSELVIDSLEHLRLLFIAALAGAVVTIARNRRVGTVVTMIAASSAALFWLMPQGKLWNARALPFWYLCLYFLAGCLFVEVVRLAEWALQQRNPATRRDNLARLEDVATQSRMLALLAVNMRLPVAVGLAEAADREAENLRTAHRQADRLAEIPRGAGAVVAVVGVVVAVGIPLNAFSFLGVETTRTNFVKSWAKWNYTGYEGEGDGPQKEGAKARKNEYFAIVDMMDKVGRTHGCGRALWEYEAEQDQFGTPDALMILPTWTDGCIGSEEGLYYESSPTVPYHFILGGYASLRPSNPQRDLPYGSMDLQTAIPMMQVMGDRYFMALTPEVQAEADADPRLEAIASSGPWSVTYDSGVKERTWKVYQVEGSELVVPLSHLPVVAGVPDGTFGKAVSAWQSMGIGWFAQSEPGRYDIPLAADGPSGWPRAPLPPPVALGPDDAVPEPVYPGSYTRSAAVELEQARQLGATVALPEVPVEPATVTNVEISNDTVSFDVDRTGTPILVKMSYFPNWKVSGAAEVYRVTPNFMVVVPTANHVSLHYGYTPVDVGGYILTVLGAGLAVLLGRRVIRPDRPLRFPLRRSGGGGGGGPGRRDPFGPNGPGVSRNPDDHPWWDDEPDLAPPPEGERVLVGAGAGPDGDGRLLAGGFAAPPGAPTPGSSERRGPQPRRRPWDGRRRLVGTHLVP